MFVKAIKKAKGSMFPIFSWKQEGATATVGVSGTGFFINPDGYFISVAHIFDNPDPHTKYYYMGLLPDLVQNPFQEITEITRDDSQDIFVGKINITNNDYFNLANQLPLEGKSVCIAGYPLASISFSDSGILQLGGVRRYFQPSFVLDIAKLNSDNGQGIIREHDGFLVRDAGLFGMSGGPVFDRLGKVLGIQGSVTSPRDSISASGRKISVENALVIKSPLIIKVLKNNKIQFNK